MAFFKSDTSLCNEDDSDSKTASKKLRYVINKDGTGRWIRPVKAESLGLSVDYDEDVPF